jgi:hypothetical protein
MHNWTIPPQNVKNQVAEIMNACGELGVTNVVTCIRQKKFLEQQKLTILSHKIMQLLTLEAQVAIKIHNRKYQWTNPLPNKAIDDGHSLLNKVLKLMRPDVQTNVYAKLAKIKSIKLVDHVFNIVK